MKLFRRIFRWSFRLLLVLIGLVLLLVILFQFHGVQTFAAKKVTNYLSTQLGTKVTVKKVKLKLFSRAYLEDVYVEDLNQDTLLYMSKADVDIKLFSFLNRKLYIENVDLENTTVYIQRSAVDSLFNFDFILRQFAGDGESSGSPWQLNLSSANLDDVNFRFKDDVSRQTMTAQVGHLDAELNNFDLFNRILDFKNANVVASSFAIIQHQSDTLSESTTSNGPLFPYTGWNISAEQLNSKDNQFILRNKNAAVTKGVFNYNDLQLDDVDFNITNVVWQKNLITAKLNQLVLEEKSGFEIRKGQFDLEMDSSQITASNLEIRTGNSLLKSSLALEYGSFDQLINSINNGHLSANINTAHISTRELLELLPPLKRLNAIDISQFKVIDVVGNISGNTRNLSLENLKVATDGVLLINTTAQIRHLTRPDLMAITGKINRMQTSYAQLQELFPTVNLPEQLAALGVITLNGIVSGKLSDFRVEAMEATTETGANVDFKGTLQNLHKPELLSYDLEEIRLNSTTKLIRDVVGRNFPSQLNQLQFIEYSGHLSGDLKNVYVDGKINTGLGSIISNLDLGFNDNYTNGKYRGSMDIASFDFSKLLPDSLMVGTVDGVVTVEGEGFTLESLDTKANMVLTQLTFRDYTYKDIRINGLFTEKRFLGKLISKDKNLKLDGQGEVDFSKKLPVINITANVDQLNLKPLGFYWEDVRISTAIRADLIGEDFNTFDGFVRLNDFKLDVEDLHYNTDSILIKEVQLKNNVKRVRIISDIVDGELQGRFNWEKLPAVFGRFIANYSGYETQESLPKDSLEISQSFDFDFQLKDDDLFFAKWIPDLNQIKKIELYGDFDEAENDLNLYGKIDSLDYSGIRTDRIIIKSQNSKTSFKNTLTFKQLELNERFSYPKVKLKSTIINDSIALNLNITNDSSRQILDLNARMAKLKDELSFRLLPKIVLSEKVWQINPNNAVLYKPGKLFIRDLLFKKGQQTIAVTSEGKLEDNLQNPIDVSFNAFQLSETSELIGIKPSELQGRLDGQIIIKDLFDNHHYNSNLIVNNLVIGANKLGNLGLNASQQPNSDVILVNANLEGALNAMDIIGTYSISKRKFDVKAEIEKLQVSIADSFLEGIIETSEGHVSGQLSLKGSPERPKLRGYLNTHDVNTFVTFNQVRYTVSDSRIKLSSYKIDFGILNLTDDNGGKARLTGGINHRYFDEILLDMQLKSEGLRLLNTSARENDLFYGIVDAKVDADILGFLDDPNVNVTAKLLPDSKFVVSPFYDSREVSREDYIVFGNPEELLHAEEESYRLNRSFPANVNLQLELEPNAEFQVIVDPLTGDRLECHGNSNLSVLLGTSGKFEMFGNYIVESGTYYFTYNELIKEEFDLEPGGVVVFNGDPTNARFNITASTIKGVSTYELIKNESSLKKEEENAARKKQDIKVVLLMEGDFNGLDISFDIQLVKQSNDISGNAVERKLATLRDNPDDLNRQVFGLLLLNSFILSDGSESLASSSGNALLSSVSSLISSQLNQLISQYVKDLDVELNLDAGTTSSTVGISVTKTLFNDRVTLSASGNLNSASSGVIDPSANFLIEYKLTDKGNYLIKIFRTDDYIIVGNYGVGFSFKKTLKNSKKRNKLKK